MGAHVSLQRQYAGFYGAAGDCQDNAEVPVLDRARSLRLELVYRRLPGWDERHGRYDARGVDTVPVAAHGKPTGDMSAVYFGTSRSLLDVVPGGILRLGFVVEIPSPSWAVDISIIGST